MYGNSVRVRNGHATVLALALKSDRCLVVLQIVIAGDDY